MRQVRLLAADGIALAGRGVRVADVVRVARESIAACRSPRRRRARPSARRARRAWIGSPPRRIAGSSHGARPAAAWRRIDRGAQHHRPRLRGRCAYRVQARDTRARRRRRTAASARDRARDDVRRIAGMACGGSGISPAVLDALVAMLNAGVHPVVPSIGSIGVADLAPLSHLALPLVGEGHAEYQGDDWRRCAGPAAGWPRRRDARPQGRALAHQRQCRHGRSRGPGDRTTSRTPLDALEHRRQPWRTKASAPTCRVLDPRVQDARPARGQREIAARIAQLLAGSALLAARRCTARAGSALAALPHAGARRGLRRTVHRCRDDVEVELNSAADSPLVLDRRRRDAVERQLSHSCAGARVRWHGPRARASRRPVRRTLPTLLLARDVGAAAAAHDARSRALGLRDDTEDADVACTTRSVTWRIQPRSIAYRSRKASRTMRRWRRTSSPRRRQ